MSSGAPGPGPPAGGASRGAPVPGRGPRWGPAWASAGPGSRGRPSGTARAAGAPGPRWSSVFPGAVCSTSSRKPVDSPRVIGSRCPASAPVSGGDRGGEPGPVLAVGVPGGEAQGLPRGRPGVQHHRQGRVVGVLRSPVAGEEQLGRPAVVEQGGGVHLGLQGRRRRRRSAPGRGTPPSGAGCGAAGRGTPRPTAGRRSCSRLGVASRSIGRTSTRASSPGPWRLRRGSR